MNRIKLCTRASILVLGLLMATQASAQVVGAGPYGVGTPVATPFNSGYYPEQTFGTFDTRSVYGVGPTGYGYYGTSDRKYRRALRRQRRAQQRALRQQQRNGFLPFNLR